ncbi:STAS domain-containing protein [Streptomyces sp. NPDC097619]|uniref:STAS domain-containing protein n=1 Tax=Streptomyces sp. NPDC097619 TaxID=3157228 RepID=UPI0033290793
MSADQEPVRENGSVHSPSEGPARTTPDHLPPRGRPTAAEDPTVPEPQTEQQPERTTEPERLVVRVWGDMDLGHAEQLRTALATALTGAPQRCEVVVDLRHSSFCDSAGLNALLEVRQRAEDSGRRITLATPSHQMLRLLQLTGTSHLFSFTEA